MRNITLNVSDDLADRFSKNQQKLEAMVRILLDRITSSESLSDVLEFSALQAKKLGITEEELKELLKDE